MGVPRIRLTQNDFVILVIAIDAYVISLQMPQMYPEHSNRYVPILENLRAILWSLVKLGWKKDFLMTEPQVIALDEAVLGFMRICERSKRNEAGYPRTLVMLNQYHQLLEEMKLPPVGKWS